MTIYAVDNSGTVWGGNNAYAGPAASASGTLSLWFRVPTAWPASTQSLAEFRTAGGNSSLSVNLYSSNRLQILGRNAAGTVILGVFWNSGAFAVDTWYNLLMSWNGGTSTVQVYVDDADQSSLLAVQSMAADSVAAIGRAAVFAGTTGGGIASAWMSNVYVSDAFTDLSVAANRRNFIDASGNPVDPLSFGSPHLLLTGNETNFFTNGGSGSNLTQTGGSLVAASSSPGGSAAVMNAKVKVWDGTGWQSKPVKVWGGAAWVVKQVKVWDGAAWKLE